MVKDDVKIRLLEIADLHEDDLKKFNRYQVTNRVRYKENDQYLYKDDYFIDFWDEQRKKRVIQMLQKCVCSEGIVAGAFTNGELIGFASVEGKFFGEKREYLELSFIHVSNEYRNQGIGKKLFNVCCEKAKEKGAKKLYISAHPAEETQHFYDSLGCVFAVEINKEIYDKGPLAIQLEVTL